MIVFMIGGRGRVGKTTAAKKISQIAYDFGFMPKHISMADPIKMEAKKHGFTKEDTPAEYRKFCQEYGAAKRAEDPNYWVDRWAELVNTVREAEEARLVEDHAFQETVVITDDVRYMNEAARGRAIGAYLIFLKSDGRELEDEDGAWREHESEELANRIDSGDKDYQDVFPFIIKNGGSLVRLMTIIEKIVPVFVLGELSAVTEEGD
jgi:hypothetical protein